MSSTYPSSPEEFSEWSTSTTCGTFSSSTRVWFELNQNNVFSLLQEHLFFATLQETLTAAAKRFESTTDSQLFALDRQPSIKWSKKSYKSFLEKLYRRNRVENHNFPEPPEGGWITLDNSFERVDDIVRTTIAVAYADGPEFLASYLGVRGEALGLSCVTKDHAKEKGYYAHHFYARMRVPVGLASGGHAYPELAVPVEIQVTTELQGALREITHRLYEEERLDGRLAAGWKQDFASGRFRAAYMAHSLRFIEAMIVDLRAQISRPKDTQ